MNIAFDARGANLYKGTGIGTYTENLLKNLLYLDNKNNYSIFYCGENFQQYKKNNSFIKLVSKKNHKFFEENYFPFHINKDDINLYHVPQNGIGIWDEISCLKIVTIHDLIPYIMPETVGKGYLLRFLKEMPRIIEKADGIITVSECSKNDILKFFPVDPNKIFVTHLSANDNFKPLNKKYCQNIIFNKYNIPPPFILYLGGFSERKNVHSLIKAFISLVKDSKSDVNLVLCGSKKDCAEKLMKLCSNSRISSKIYFTDYVDEVDLPIFYNSCEVFVYPSMYEGFGLPPLEAMSCAVPVIASNTSSIAEIVKDSAILIDPLDTDSLSRTLYNVLNNDILKADLCQKGFRHSLNFSWIKTAMDTLEIYDKVLNK